MLGTKRAPPLDDRRTSLCRILSSKTAPANKVGYSSHEPNGRAEYSWLGRSKGLPRSTATAGATSVGPAGPPIYPFCSAPREAQLAYRMIAPATASGRQGR